MSGASSASKYIGMILGLLGSTLADPITATDAGSAKAAGKTAP
jgi:hypothetical protein